jgi:hypothetical protein
VHGRVSLRQKTCSRAETHNKYAKTMTDKTDIHEDTPTPRGKTTA